MLNGMHAFWHLLADENSFNSQAGFIPDVSLQ